MEVLVGEVQQGVKACLSGDVLAGAKVRAFGFDVIVEAGQFPFFVVLLQIAGQRGIIGEFVEAAAVEDDIVAAAIVLLYRGFEERRFRTEVQVADVFGLEAVFLDVGVLIAARDGGSSDV